MQARLTFEEAWRGAERSVTITRHHACHECAGSGYQRVCHGQGATPRTDTLKVQAPPGTPDSARLRLAGQGHAGVRGGAPGDLYVDVRVEPHEVFRRDGDDVHMVLPIAVHEAGLGARIEVVTPDGKAWAYDYLRQLSELYVVEGLR